MVREHAGLALLGAGGRDDRERLGGELGGARRVAGALRHRGVVEDRLGERRGERRKQRSLQRQRLGADSQRGRIVSETSVGAPNRSQQVGPRRREIGELAGDLGFAPGEQRAGVGRRPVEGVRFVEQLGQELRDRPRLDRLAGLAWTIHEDRSEGAQSPGWWAPAGLECSESYLQYVAGAESRGRPPDGMNARSQ